MIEPVLYFLAQKLYRTNSINFLVLNLQFSWLAWIDTFRFEFLDTGAWHFAWHILWLKKWWLIFIAFIYIGSKMCKFGLFLAAVWLSWNGHRNHYNFTNFWSYVLKQFSGSFIRAQARMKLYRNGLISPNIPVGLWLFFPLCSFIHFFILVSVSEQWVQFILT